MACQSSKNEERIGFRGRHPLLSYLFGQMHRASFIMLIGDGNRKAERAAPVNLALDRELPAVELDDALRQKYGYGTKARGVVVTDVADGSPAALKDIKAGSLIIEAARKRAAAKKAAATDGAGYTALHWAGIRGHWRIFAELIAAGADYRTTDRAVLHHRVRADAVPEAPLRHRRVVGDEGLHNVGARGVVGVGQHRAALDVGPEDVVEGEVQLGDI